MAVVELFDNDRPGPLNLITIIETYSASVALTSDCVELVENASPKELFECAT